MSAAVAAAPSHPHPPPPPPHPHSPQSTAHLDRGLPSPRLPRSAGLGGAVLTPQHPPPSSSSSTSSSSSASSSHQNHHHQGGEPAQKRPRSDAGSPAEGDASALSNGKRSPTSARGPAGHAPMIKVKKEPGSPTMPTSKRRPNRLDLSASTPDPSRASHTSRPSAGPLTSQQSAGLAIQDVGLACLSPGFQTNDPSMREQLQRSLDVRDRQRMIIEARQKGKTSAPGDGGGGGGGGGGSASAGTAGADRPQDSTLFGMSTPRGPSTSRRKGPPPGLAISAPAASHFTNERVIQSAPLHHSFTGLHRNPPGPSALGQTSHIHNHVAPQSSSSNRLPPIADVFANDRLDGPRGYHSPGHNSNGNGAHAAAPSPGFPPTSHAHAHGPPPPPLSARTREFRSAEEAVQSMSGGRDELMPKVVHYGGVQPPTPPSPMPPGNPHHHHHHQHQHHGHHHQHHQHYHDQQSASAPLSQPSHESSRPDLLARTSSMNGRRRGRDEYERDNGSPPGRYNTHESKRTAYAPFRPDSRDEDWRVQMSSAEKKEEFLRLCERAWDLFHS